ncbi:hypothetical protein ADL27_20645, partial [Streptomyces sp. NRRL F-6602]
AALWLQELQRAQVEARQYEYVPLPRIQACGAVERGADLFRTLVVFENYPMDDEAAAAHGLRLRRLAGTEATNYPLNLIAYAGDDLSYTLAYDAALYDEATAGRLCGRLEALLGSLAAADGGTPVSAVGMLTEAEAEQTVRGWNDTSEELTYRQLDERANRLAHHLVALGAGRGSLVGLCLE